LTRHAAEHATLLREVEGYRDNAVFGARQLNQVLCNWLMSHTMMEDRPLAHHVLQLRASRSDSAEGTKFAGGIEPAPQSAIHSKSDSDTELASGQ
jgi:hemerythrin